ncbi:ribosomal protection-like ABC-F family protein [Companilactobacillus sp.]|jgi:lincosamide and streptogramin A transport system ATP-binding/permease protein|uniref:ribosomal protection-like ABC-F family protein n=1 Tax=Companilactobacillus sp. TaxID=2767905 RepID=UPI0025BAE445|nr:ATP-binding cassette domain-containing protein [Companilactobacillus sp.]MCH4010124.1 ATP-binding cassette domain-containing protein [Companilactobacillus sp.]MCH4052200.1 ATP-binding cassette domain-containing protein [Companilactobacillus sp.]MCH4078066.1 ATP-binding cassette domain-containing protein [Companilactobacillus sp.]MCH4126642.1 ATP-binding cassette domain-containing protein [Companilactobacillus sp.]MCH4132227.1 ATP-binding cassette domain-containing protein [Companilactobacil
MGTIQIEKLSFKYDQMTENLFDSVNLSIDGSWKLGLIGRNGRGKTTLLNLLMNKFQYQGNIVTDLNFYYYPQPVSDPTQTARNIAIELSGIEEYDIWKVEQELEKLKIDLDVLDRQFNTLSPGERTKLLLAVMFIDDEGFQLIDEPTNHLDIEGRQVVANYLRGKKGFIVISHDRGFLNEVIDHVISINRNDIDVYQGNFDTWEHEKNLQDQSELAEKAQLKKDIHKLKASAAKKENWAQQTEKSKSKNIKMDQHSNLDKGFIGHKSAKMMKKAGSIQRRANAAVEKKQSLLKNIEITDPISLNYEEISHFDQVITADKLQLFNDHVQTPEVSFQVKTGQVTALLGKNGIGKSTIFRRIMQIPQPFEQRGEIQIKNGLKVSYLPQESKLRGTIKQVAETDELDVESIFSNLRKLGFERELFNDPIENMSQGQKRKVALSISLSQPANLYLWDEPFNYLDVITRDQIIAAIQKQHPTMLIIDHDLGLIDDIATQKVILKD